MFTLSKPVPLQSHQLESFQVAIKQLEHISEDLREVRASIRGAGLNSIGDKAIMELIEHGIKIDTIKLRLQQKIRCVGATA